MNKLNLFICKLGFHNWEGSSKKYHKGYTRTCKKCNKKQEVKEIEIIAKFKNI